MPDIRFVCLSDLHFGQEDCILTKLKPLSDIRPDEQGSDPLHPSPALEALCSGIRTIIEAGGMPDRKPTLIFNGDILENALTTMNHSLMTFERFIELVLPDGGELFDRIVYIPGNHDHHMWELARESQYVDFITGIEPGKFIDDAWHKTRLLETPERSTFPVGYLLKKIIGRYDHLKDFNVQVAYPNFGLYDDPGGKCVVFHHGHFVESIYLLMSELATMLFPKRKKPGTVDEIETENFAWIDFFWSTMGRSGKVGGLVENIYISLGVKKARNRIIDNFSKSVAACLLKMISPGLASIRFIRDLKGLLLKFLLKKIADGAVLRERARDEGVPLSEECRKGMHAYISGPLLLQMNSEIERVTEGKSKNAKKMTFIFGHTHKPFETGEQINGFSVPVHIFNTGGWVVEKTKPAPQYGGSVVFLDENLNVSSLRLYSETENPDGSPVVVNDVMPEKNPSVLTKHLREVIRSNPEEWKRIAKVIADEIRLHREYLNKRIQWMERG